MIQETSIDSYEQLKSNGILSERHGLIYDTLRTLGVASDSMITDYLQKKDPNFVRPRRKELLNMGLIEAFEKMECPITHMTVWFWTLKDFPLRLVKVEELKAWAVIKKDWKLGPECEGLLVFKEKENAKSFAEKHGETIKMIVFR